MRRLLALVPAVVLVLALAAPAQAGSSFRNVNCPNKIDPGFGTGATMTLTWFNSGTVNSANQPIYLLRKVTLTNTCMLKWAKFTLLVEPGYPETWFVVAPGATRTLGESGLTHLGLWKFPFARWSANVGVVGTTACGYAFNPTYDTPFYVQADGSIKTSCQ